jgi:hypothetical protein
MLAYPEPSIAWERLATYLGDRFDPTLTDFDTLRRFLEVLGTGRTKKPSSLAHFTKISVSSR